MFRLFQRHQVSTSRPPGFCDLEGSPSVGSPEGPPVEFKSLTYTHSFNLVCRFQKSPKRLGEGKVKMKDVTVLFSPSYHRREGGKLEHPLRIIYVRQSTIN